MKSRNPLMARISEMNPHLLEGLTFDHPSLDFLNSLYFQIWTKDFGRYPWEFKPLADICFPNVVLPVPLFITTTLAKSAALGNWSSFDVRLLRHTISDEKYIVNLSDQIVYYRNEGRHACEQAISESNLIYSKARLYVESGK